MRFTIKVDKEWLDTLEGLTTLVAAQGNSTPEAVLEQAIFAQIKNQQTPQETLP